MKRICILLAIILLAGTALCACGTQQGISFVRIGDLDKQGYKTPEWLSDYDVDPDDYACIISEEAAGDIEIPAEHDGDPVVLLYNGFDTYSRDSKITSVKLPEGLRFIDGFSPTEVKTVELPSTLQLIIFSFYGMYKLQSIRLPDGLEKIHDSFNSCRNLKEVAYEGDGQLSVTESFDSSYLKTEINSIEYRQEYEQKQKEDQQKREAAERKKAEQNRRQGLNEAAAGLIDGCKNTIDRALQKLADSGAVEATFNDDGKFIGFEFEVDDSGEDRCDELKFRDAEVKARLTCEPDISLDDVAVMIKGELNWYDTDGNMYRGNYLSEVKEKAETGSDPISALYATDFDSCRYILTYTVEDSDYTTDHYSNVYNSSITTSRNRYDTTTIVWIIDAKKQEVISIRNLGTNEEPARIGGGKITDVHASGKDDEAEDYIFELLTRSAKAKE